MRRTTQPRGRTRRTRPGITLLEVLISLLILVIGMAALGQLVDMGTTSAVDAQVRARGSRLAQSKMAEVEAGAVDFDVGETDFADEPGWKWSVSSESAGAGGIPLYLVTVKVSRTLGADTRTVTLSQHVLAPAAVASAAPSEVALPAPSGSTPAAGGSP